jgi:hypothetical protein
MVQMPGVRSLRQKGVAAGRWLSFERAVLAVFPLLPGALPRAVVAARATVDCEVTTVTIVALLHVTIILILILILKA